MVKTKTILAPSYNLLKTEPEFFLPFRRMHYLATNEQDVLTKNKLKISFTATKEDTNQMYQQWKDLFSKSKEEKLGEIVYEVNYLFNRERSLPALEDLMWHDVGKIDVINSDIFPLAGIKSPKIILVNQASIMHSKADFNQYMPIAQQDPVKSDRYTIHVASNAGLIDKLLTTQEMF